MASFGSLGATPKSRFNHLRPESHAVRQQQDQEQAGERGQTAVEPGTEARVSRHAQTKAAWPRCGDAHKYLYKFANGESICTQGWREEFYYHVVKGTLPPAHLFDPAARERLGIAANPVIGTNTNRGFTSHPLFIPIAAVGVGGIALLLVLGNR